MKFRNIAYLAMTCVCLAVPALATEVSIEHNPGELSASITGQLDAPKGIVVLLHGCGQDSKSFAKNSGFLEESKKRSVAILNIEQNKNNNVQACFNWFSEQDNKAGSGELASIEHFITKTQNKYPEVPTYLVGLSAGGAMASAVLLQKPDLFDGAAIVAGIPYPCANNLIQAIACMKSGSSMSVSELAKPFTKKSNEQWPSLLIFTGDNDVIVNAKNSQQMAEQYAAIIGASPIGAQKSTPVPGITQTTWRAGKNKNAISLYSYSQLGHGIPVTLEESEPSLPAFYLPTKRGVASIVMDTWF